MSAQPTAPLGRETGRWAPCGPTVALPANGRSVTTCMSAPDTGTAEEVTPYHKASSNQATGTGDDLGRGEKCGEGDQKALQK